MKWTTPKGYKAVTGLTILSFCIGVIVNALYKETIVKSLKFKITPTSTATDTQQHNSSKQEESIPVYFYKKQSDIGNPFSECKHKCHLKDGFTKDRNAVIVFQGPALSDQKPLKKYPGQLWVFFSMEPPSLHPSSSKLKMWENVFNWTIGYRRDTDILHTYGRFHILPETKKPKNISSTWNSQSNKSLIFVSHCGVASKRLPYIKKLNSFYDVDIYGGCGNLKCPKSEWGRCHDKIRSYKFYLAFENSLCKDYVTEKMFKIYWDHSHAIPVGRGRSLYELFFPPKSYLDTSKYQSTKELSEHMWRLSKNEPEATTYFKWTRSYYVGRSVNEQRGFCELCRRIHDPDIVKKHTRLYMNINTWLRGSGHTQICKTPTDLQ